MNNDIQYSQYESLLYIRIMVLCLRHMQFVNFTEVASRYPADSSQREAAFALKALMEIPDQYKVRMSWATEKGGRCQMGDFACHMLYMLWRIGSCHICAHKDTPLSTVLLCENRKAQI